MYLVSRRIGICIVIAGLLCMANSFAAIPPGFDWYDDVHAIPAVESALDEVLTDAAVEDRFLYSRETLTGYSIVMFHNDNDGVTLNTVLASVSDNLQASGMSIARVGTEPYNDGHDSVRLVFEIDYAGVLPYTLSRSAPIDPLFGGGIGYLQADLLDVLGCCETWHNCDGKINEKKCEACGGKQQNGLCVADD